VGTDSVLRRFLLLPDFTEKAGRDQHAFTCCSFIESSADQLDVLRWVYRNLKTEWVVLYRGHKGEPTQNICYCVLTPLYYAFSQGEWIHTAGD
jgi:hypothetical protein